MPVDATWLSDGVDRYLELAEADVPALQDHARKHVVWAGAAEEKTPLALVYVHGFSASLQELRPLPDLVAAYLGANLFFTRLTGHGQDALAMGEASLSDWLADLNEALSIGGVIGERVVVMGSSNGGALSALAHFADLDRPLAGLVLISPNFRINSPLAPLLTLPGAPKIIPKLTGTMRSFPPRSAAHAQFWTTRYPVKALFPLAQTALQARRLAFEQARAPALFVLDDADQVVVARTTRTIAKRWGVSAEVMTVDLGAGDDPKHHVLAGDALSPSMTETVRKRVSDWTRSL